MFYHDIVYKPTRSDNEERSADIALSQMMRLGIPEPVSGIAILPEILDVVFVPLLAYDEKGHRIGYGKGFYDRFLKKCRPDTIFVGLSFFGPEPQIDFEATDVPLHYCVTPEGILDFS